MAEVTINKITVKHIVDECPDLSYLGEYSDKPAEIHIDRQERGIYRPRECRYFNLGCGDAEYIEQDYRRAEAYNAGLWFSMGIVAEAEVVYDIGQGNRRIEHLSSGGLWGIESDSDNEYIEEVENGQLADLKDHLAVFGVDVSKFETIEIERE